jgi:ectoine hydroxylase
VSAGLADPYHSRVSGAWSVGERVDPVVWGEAPGPLSEAELAEYAARGFLVKPALFSAQEVAAVLAEAERLARGLDRSRDDVISEPGSDAVRSVFRVHRGEGPLGRLTRDPRLAEVARQILGSPVYVHQSRVNFKPAFAGQPFHWHSDFETWHSEDGMPAPRALSASLLLTSNTEHNGPLLVVPGSHRRYVRCIGETPTDHFKQSLQQQRYGVPDPAALVALVEQGSIASITGPVGTVVFFDCNLMHGSAGNITPLPRHNLFVVYNSIHNALAAPYCGRPARPAFLAERDVEPLST